jgi:hypothetical protein
MCVFIALFIQHGKSHAPYCIGICGLFGSITLFHIILYYVLREFDYIVIISFGNILHSVCFNL